MIDQPQPPVPSENDYGARPIGPIDLNSEDWDEYDGEVREPGANRNHGSGGLGEWDAGDDDAPIPPRGWLLGTTYCRKFVSSLLGGGGEGKIKTWQKSCQEKRSGKNSRVKSRRRTTYRYQPPNCTRRQEARHRPRRLPIPRRPAVEPVERNRSVPARNESRGTNRTSSSKSKPVRNSDSTSRGSESP